MWEALNAARIELDRLGVKCDCENLPYPCTICIVQRSLDEIPHSAIGGVEACNCQACQTGDGH